MELKYLNLELKQAFQLCQKLFTDNGTVCFAHPSFVGVMAKWVLFGHIQEKLSVGAPNLQGHVHMLNFSRVLSLFEVSNVPRVEH